MKDLTHLDAEGRARMVNVGAKPESSRMARAEGSISMRVETLDVIARGTLKKGDVLAAARIAGIMAAKRTPELIPMCHPLMLNDAGNVAECTADNVFIIKKGQIFTPPIAAGALRGITRSVVFEIADELEIKISETNITRHDVFVADECFLTGTAAEVIPVIKADGRMIGNGKPGTISGRVIARFRELTRASGTPIYS